MTFSPIALLRPEITRMTPYKPIKPFHVLSRELGIPIEKIVKLDANENPYGPSPKALEALAAMSEQVPVYPDPGSVDLREELARHLGVDAAQVVIGSGADEIIEFLFKLFAGPGDTIINCTPTFGMYTICAALFGNHECVIARGQDFRMDINAIEAAVNEHAAKMVFVCNPNNPDGGVISEDDLKRLLKLDTIVVLDEAYAAFMQPDLEAEFGPQNHARMVADYPNLIVLRTFSKWAGLAGLRCGYGILTPELAHYVMSIKQPYNVNIAARVAALASLDDIPLLSANVQKIRQHRAQLYEELAQFDALQAWPDSQTNFVLAKVVKGDAGEVAAALRQRGVLIRHFKLPGLEDKLRISVGTPEQIVALIENFKEVL
jgi:histidinol-phosphate aminotransferase